MSKQARMWLRGAGAAVMVVASAGGAAMGDFQDEGSIKAPVVEWCPADTDHDGRVDMKDFYPFLAYWFAGDCGGDVNFDGRISPQDIFDFLGMLAVGSCPVREQTGEK